ncbi:nef protein, partial [Human immunodeficiency virus 1]
MGSKWSKSWPLGWPRVREPPPPTPRAREGSRDLSQHVDVPGTITNNANTTGDSTRLEDEEEDDAVGFPVPPQAPPLPGTFDVAFVLNYFGGQDGGLYALIYSKILDESLDLRVCFIPGCFPDWPSYGIR